MAYSNRYENCTKFAQKNIHMKNIVKLLALVVAAGFIMEGCKKYV